MTPGIVPTTLDGMNLGEFTKIKDSLKDESFNFKPGRRIKIPKSNGGTRPLIIARDKIVQEAMRIILNAIYEPMFLKSSHGFRPSKSCHTA
jgi:retron-type reverse transcriptase